MACRDHISRPRGLGARGSIDEGGPGRIGEGRRGHSPTLGLARPDPGRPGRLVGGDRALGRPPPHPLPAVPDGDSRPGVGARADRGEGRADDRAGGRALLASGRSRRLAESLPDRGGPLGRPRFPSPWGSPKRRTRSGSAPGADSRPECSGGSCFSFQSSISPRHDTESGHVPILARTRARFGGAIPGGLPVRSADRLASGTPHPARGADLGDPHAGDFGGSHLGRRAAPGADRARRTLSVRRGPRRRLREAGALVPREHVRGVPVHRPAGSEDVPALVAAVLGLQSRRQPVSRRGPRRLGTPVRPTMSASSPTRAGSPRRISTIALRSNADMKQ